MKDRKPYQLKNILVLYNFGQVIVSAWMFWEALDSAWLRDYSWQCQGVDYSDNPQSLRVKFFFFFRKLITIFIIHKFILISLGSWRIAFILLDKNYRTFRYSFFCSSEKK